MPARLLLVDDEASIRRIARLILEQEGYEINEAGSGAEAIDLLSHEAQPDLLVADVDMPEMSGGEMARRIRLAQPDLKVLYVTGNIDMVMDARPLWEGEAFLERPFTPAALREAVALLVHGRLEAPHSS